jgi:DNA-binding beta-propeller fold protein YncE
MDPGSWIAASTRQIPEHFDLATGALVRETVTGRLASDLAVSPDGRWIVCANAGSDTVSVLDRDGALVETLWARSKPSDLLQASPNAVCFAHDGERLSSPTAR